jgi:hypothetical protein
MCRQFLAPILSYLNRRFLASARHTTASRCRRFATSYHFVVNLSDREAVTSREATTAASRSVTSVSEEPTVKAKKNLSQELATHFIVTRQWCHGALMLFHGDRKNNHLDLIMC